MEFQWLNESEMTERDGVISIFAPEHTDFFCNSGAEAEEGDAVPDSLCNAPFYYTEVEGISCCASRCRTISSRPMTPARSWCSRT